MHMTISANVADIQACGSVHLAVAPNIFQLHLSIAATLDLTIAADVATAQVALLECEIGGRIIHYGHKMASTYLCPMRVLDIRSV